MNKALTLIQKIEEIGYYGQKDDYGTEGYDQDTKEYMAPFADLQLPDKSKAPRPEQTKSHRRKSRGEDHKGDKVN